MTTKGFYIDDVEHTVIVAHYSPGYSAKTNCEPDDGWEGSAWEIEFEDIVSAENGDCMSFENFISAYAKEHFKGVSRRALDKVEEACRQEVLTAGNEYEA